MTLSTAPRAHRDPASLAAKLDRIGEPHVAPLNELSRRITSETGHAVPWFDPDSGGARSRVLFLFEAPGPKATPARGSGIISPDNNDGSAENMWRLHEDSGLARTAVVPWNVVPWYVGTDTKIRAVAGEDIDAAAPFLGALIDLLPELALVVTFGVKPRQGWFRYLLRPEAALVPTLAVPHPSPQSINTNPGNRAVILAAMRKVSAVLAG